MNTSFKRKMKHLCFVMTLLLTFSGFVAKAAITIDTVPIDGTPINVNISSTSDVRYYKLIVSSPSSIKVACSSIPSYDMGLSYSICKESNGAPDVTSTVDAMDLKESSIHSLDRSTKVSSGTYYIRLSGLAYSDGYSSYKGWSGDSFTLSVFIFDSENNENYSTATEITSGYNSTTYISALNDYDWYKITINQACSLHVKVGSEQYGEGALPSYDMGLSYILYKSSTSVPDVSNPVDAEELTDNSVKLMDKSTKVTPGIYYIRLQGIAYESSYETYKGWSDKAFKLNISTFDEENNEIYSTAISISSGYNAITYISSPKDTDWYKINISEACSLHFQAGNQEYGTTDSLPSYDMGLSYAIFKANSGIPDISNPIDTADLKDDSIKLMDRSTKITPGTYYIRLQGIAYEDSYESYKGWSAQGFSLKINTLDAEDNEIYSTATAINSGTVLNPSISAPNDIDWYKISITKASSLYVALGNSEYGATDFLPLNDMGLSFNIYKDKSGVPDTSNPVDTFDLKDSDVKFLERSNKLLPGIYYIKLQGISYEQSYSYYKGWSERNFKFTINTFDEENNDTYSTATLVNSGTTLNPTISALNDTDWFKITATAYSTFRLTEAGLPSKDMGLSYALYKEVSGAPDISAPLDNLEIKYSDDTNFDKVIKVQPGVYYIKLSGVSYSQSYSDYKGWSKSPFNLTFELFDCENNDTYSKATVIQNEAENEGFISVPGDIDWYKINVPQACVFDLSLSYNDFTIYKLNENNSLSELNNNKTFDAVQGTYFIKVNNISNSYWGSVSYKLKVSLWNKLQSNNSYPNISLSWQPVSGAKTYAIMRKEGVSEYALLVTLNSNLNSYLDTSVKPFTQYTYYIKTEGGVLNTSSISFSIPNNVKNILYENSNGIFSYNFYLNKTTQLTSSNLNYYFDVSKQKIYYVASNGLHSINTDGTGDKIILSGIKSKSEFDVSSDGKNIIYIKLGSIYYCNNDGLSSTLLSSSYPDCSSVTWINTTGALGYKFTSGNKIHVIANNLNYTENINSFISPDGKKIIQVRDESGNENFYLIDKATNTEKLIHSVSQYVIEGNITVGAYLSYDSVRWSSDNKNFALLTDQCKYAGDGHSFFSQSAKTEVNLFDSSGVKLSLIYSNEFDDVEKSGFEMETSGKYLILKKGSSSFIKFFDSNNAWMELAPSFSAFDVMPLSVPYVDVNQDNIIDIKDLSTVSLKYNLKEGSSGWSPAYDFNSDKRIDIYDLVLISKNMDSN